MPGKKGKKRARLQALVCLKPGIYLATTYSHRTYRPTTIGAAAFHFRVRNGTGWFHRALVTRGQPRVRHACLDFGAGTLGISSLVWFASFQHLSSVRWHLARSY